MPSLHAETPEKGIVIIVAICGHRSLRSDDDDDVCHLPSCWKYSSSFYAFFIITEEPIRPAAVRVSEGSQRSFGGNPELRMNGTGDPTH